MLVLTGFPSLPPPFTSSVNALPERITGILSALRKTQSLKNKYIMPIAVEQVGVVAV